jgi:hypothetical protein
MSARRRLMRRSIALRRAPVGVRRACGDAVIRRFCLFVACTSFASLLGCAGTPPAPAVVGKPIGEFFDELKAELRDVHWRIRSDRAACGTTAPREVDLRNATITLDLQRIGEANVDGQLRLVAIPLAGGFSPFLSATASRKWTQEIVLKLDVVGPARLHEVDQASTAAAAGAVAGSLNAAIDGFMRSSAEEPCIRLSSLKLTFVIDVRQDAAGGFKLVVPVAEAGVDASRRDVNTLTLSWDKVVSNALR